MQATASKLTKNVKKEAMHVYAKEKKKKRKRKKNKDKKTTRTCLALNLLEPQYIEQLLKERKAPKKGQRRH